MNRPLPALSRSSASSADNAGSACELIEIGGEDIARRATAGGPNAFRYSMLLHKSTSAWSESEIRGSYDRKQEKSRRCDSTQFVR
jgi:hypothetical protein